MPMKTAEERAADVLELCGFDRGAAWNVALPLIARSFKDHARDQRHLCAEAANTMADLYPENHPFRLISQGFANEAHARVMNTKAPGLS